jgi:hypothetical protein
MRRGVVFREVTRNVEAPIEMGWDGPIEVAVDGRHRQLCLAVEGSSGVEACAIVRLEMRGTAAVTISRVDLAHRRMGDVTVAYAGVDLFGSPGLLVASVSKHGEELTVRLPDVADDLVPLYVDLFGEPPSDESADTGE